MRIGFTLVLLLIIAAFALLHAAAWAQAGVRPIKPSHDPAGPESRPEPLARSYEAPSQKERFRRYLSWMFAPYSLASVTFVSGLHQAERNPPDWQEEWAGFGQRMASNFGTAAASATARYALSEALQEDTLYRRCRCTGFWPRFRHAVFSPFFARRGPDGHEAFGLPNLLAPYAGPFAAVYGWYPSRYDWEDAFRMGNHGVLSEAGTNVAIEFLPTILHRWGRRWQKRLHLSIPSGAPGAPKPAN